MQIGAWAESLWRKNAVSVDETTPVVNGEGANFDFQPAQPQYFRQYTPGMLGGENVYMGATNPYFKESGTSIVQRPAALSKYLIL